MSDPIFAGGLGKAKSAFRDRASQKEIERDRVRAAQGKTSRYFTFDEFMARLTGKGNGEFPLRGLSRVIVVGNGDSARVAIEALLGYGPEMSQSIQTLDRVGEGIWIGQKAKTRDEFLRCERPRYHQLAVEFPRDEKTPDNARIRPVAERGAKFSLLAERPTVFTPTKRALRADAVIDCTGFGANEPGRPIPLAGPPRTLRAGSKLRLCEALNNAIEIVLICRSVTPQTPPSGKKRYEGTVQRFAGNAALSEAFEFATDYVDRRETGAALEKAVQAKLNLKEGLRLYLQATILPVVSVNRGGVITPVARQANKGERVYYIGPQAGLPTPAGEGRDDIPEESVVALWRYSEEVTAFAEYYFAVLASERAEARSLTPTFPPMELPKAVLPTRGEESVIAMPTGERRSYSLSANSERLFRYLIAENLHGFRLPEGVKVSGKDPVALTIHFTPIAHQPGEEGMQIQARAEGRLLRRINPQPLMEAMVADDALQQIILAWGFPTKAFERAGKATTTTVPLTIRRNRLLFQGNI